MNKLKYRTINFVEAYDFDNLVQDVYQKPYRFQQQDGCMSRGTYALTVDPRVDESRGSCYYPIKEEVNGSEMGVPFELWLSTDPEEHKERNGWASYEVDIFWERNFYPNVNVLAADLCRKGHIDEGAYIINIDW